MKFINPLSFNILQKPPKAVIITDICIIADAEDFTESIRQLFFITIFLLCECDIFSDNNPEKIAQKIFPDKTERKIIRPEFVSGYKTALTVPVIKAGPEEKQKQFIRSAVESDMSLFALQSETSFIPAG